MDANGVGWTDIREQSPNLVTKAGGTKEFQVSDHLASLRVSVEGATKRHLDYDPWGNQIGTPAAGERSTFNAQECDPENQFFDLSDRNYDPITGRFLRPDRLLEKYRGISPYGYCAGNPLRLTDPTGMQLPDADDPGTGQFGALGGVGGPSGGAGTPTASSPASADVAAEGAAVEGAAAEGTAAEEGVMNLTETTEEGEGVLKGAGESADAQLGSINTSTSASEPQVLRSAGEGTTTLYRAVGVREFNDVMTNQAFRPGGNSLEGRQFAFTLQEAFDYAATDLSKVAVLEVTIPSQIISKFDFSMSIDPHIFVNGVITVQPEEQILFNESILSISAH